MNHFHYGSTPPIGVFGHGVVEAMSTVRRLRSARDDLDLPRLTMKNTPHRTGRTRGDVLRRMGRVKELLAQMPLPALPRGPGSDALDEFDHLTLNCRLLFDRLDKGSQKPGIEGSDVGGLVSSRVSISTSSATARLSRLCSSAGVSPRSFSNFIRRPMMSLGSPSAP